MPIKELPIFGQYNVQQFLQVSPEDCANWTLLKVDPSKKGFAMYPAFGRKHVKVLETNILNFPTQPRRVKESIDYMYVFEGQQVYRYDGQFNRISLNPTDFNTTDATIYFTYLVAPSYTLVVFTDGKGMWVHNEATDSTVKVTDSNLLTKPTALIAFGNRIAVTSEDSAAMVLSQINLGALSGANINPATCFTVNGAQLSAYESEPIVNFAVLHNTLYVFLRFTTSIWSNSPSVFPNATGAAQVQFPWKKNTTYNFDYGLAQPFALDVDFGRMAWLGNNRSGLTQVVVSTGGQPEVISNKAVDILLERDAVEDELSPLLARDTRLFLYQYQNTVYCRLAAGKFFDFGILDVQDLSSSIEFNFDTNTWKRCIELNGERNRIQDHVYFANRHLVIVEDEGSIYELSGQFFVNEIRNEDQDNVQASDAFIPQPMRYERVTSIIAEPDYGEFLTDWVQIDFVWGDRTFINSDRPFENTVFIVDEDGSFLITEEGEYIIEDGSNYPVIDSTTYYNWFKPSIELYFSDDGGVSYFPADVREFSQLGVYSWRMRWYQLGPSRNRVYKLVAVSPAPIIILGAIMETRRASGGAA